MYISIKTHPIFLPIKFYRKEKLEFYKNRKGAHINRINISSKFHKHLWQHFLINIVWSVNNGERWTVSVYHGHIKKQYCVKHQLYYIILGKPSQKINILFISTTYDGQQYSFGTAEIAYYQIFSKGKSWYKIKVYKYMYMHYMETTCSVFILVGIYFQTFHEYLIV